MIIISPMTLTPSSREDNTQRVEEFDALPLFLIAPELDQHMHTSYPQYPKNTVRISLPQFLRKMIFEAIVTTSNIVYRESCSDFENTVGRFADGWRMICDNSILHSMLILWA